MAYIRWGERLPSGNQSSSYVLGGPDGLISIDKGGLIPYSNIREWFKTKADPEIKQELGRRLELHEEELEVVCSRLFSERDSGEWEKKFEFESKK
jgi:hypothetical protein